MMSLYFAFNRGYRAHPMPHTLEAFKLVEVADMRARTDGRGTNVWCLSLAFLPRFGRIW